MTQRTVITSIGAGGFVAAVVLGFIGNEVTSGTVIAASVLLLILGLFAERVQSITAKVAGNEISIPLHPMSTVARELRELTERASADPDSTIADLEAIVSKLESQIIAAVIESVDVHPVVGFPTLNAEQLLDHRELDIEGTFVARQPERVKGIRVDVLDGDTTIATGHVHESQVANNAAGRPIYQGVTDNIPVGTFEMVTTLELEGGDEVTIDRQSFDTEASRPSHLA